MGKGANFSSPLRIDGVTVVDESGNLVGDITAGAGSIGSDEIADSVLKVKKVTLTADEIVGTAAGDVGHANGAILVAAEAGKVHEFVSAVLSYNFDTAAYTGGGDDNVIQQGTTAVSAAIAGADLLKDTEDDIVFVSALSAADIKLTANSALALAGTALTQPGEAAGTLDVFITYRVHTL